MEINNCLSKAKTKKGAAYVIVEEIAEAKERRKVALAVNSKDIGRKYSLRKKQLPLAHTSKNNKKFRLIK